MRQILASFPRAIFLAIALVGAGGAAHGQVFGSFSSVSCHGSACGGTGASPFLYAVTPYQTTINFFEVGVEDGDINHYGNFVHPTNWQVSIVTSSRFHDEGGTVHGDTTSKAGTCPFVLRFEKGALGAGQTAAFEIGFAYLLPGKHSFHDAAWKITGRQTQWGMPVGGGQGPVHSPMRLNVLLIVLDDVGLDKLASYDELFDDMDGSPDAGTRTPVLDQLAEDGIRFDNYYTNPLCSTSRACLLTGRYAFRTGIGAVMQQNDCGGSMDCVQMLQDDDAEPPEDEMFLPQLLKDGFANAADRFRCGAFGKWHLNYWTPDLDPPGGEPLTFEAHAVEEGFDVFYGIMSNVAHGPRFPVDDEPDELDHNTWYKAEHVPPNQPVRTKVDEVWSATEVRQDAVSWINAQNDPFFAYVCFNPPHVPVQAPLEAVWPDLLSQDTQDALSSCGDPCADDTLLYAAMLESVDTEIGNLLDEMPPGRRANTMIFVVADNGTPNQFIVPPYHPDTHGKTTVYNLGVHVPMIVSGPLVPESSDPPWESSALVNVVDLWSTIEEITGADRQLAYDDEYGDGNPWTPCATDWVDSVSFLPVIEDPTVAGERDWVFSQRFGPNAEPIDICTPGTLSSYCWLNVDWRTVTDGTYKLIRMRPAPSPSDCDDFVEELYCIGGPGTPFAVDLKEEENLITHPNVGLTTLDTLRTLMASLGD